MLQLEPVKISAEISILPKTHCFYIWFTGSGNSTWYACGDPFLFRWVLLWKIKSISMTTTHDKLTAQFYILSCKIIFPPHVTPKIRHNFRLLVSLTLSPPQDMSSNKKLNFIEVVVVSTKLQVSKRSISSKSNNSPLLPESDDSRKESVVAQFL